MKVELAPPEAGFDASVQAGIGCGRIAAVLLVVDVALTLASRTLTSFIAENMSNGAGRAVLSVLEWGEVLAALVFMALVVTFMASGVLSVKKARGRLTVLQGLCLSTVSGAITGAMATGVLVLCMVTMALLSMPRNGYITMLMSFSPDSFFGMLMWLPVIALLAIVAGIGYGGVGLRFNKLY